MAGHCVLLPENALVLHTHSIGSEHDIHFFHCRAPWSVRDQQSGVSKSPLIVGCGPSGPASDRRKDELREPRRMLQSAVHASTPVRACRRAGEAGPDGLAPQHEDGAKSQLKKPNSQRRMMIGIGMPISQSKPPLSIVNLHASMT